MPETEMEFRGSRKSLKINGLQCKKTVGKIFWAEMPESIIFPARFSAF